MTRRALCIGINQFVDRDAPPLNGCVNDAHNIAEILHGSFGFGGNDVRVLTDGQATKAAVLDSLDWLVSSARAGDQLVLFASSHGSSVPDLNGDEDDNEDEVFIAHDHDWEHNVFIDDEIAQHIVRLPAGSSLVSLWDTCHSGTMSDAARAAQTLKRGMRRPLAAGGYRDGVHTVLAKHLPHPRGYDHRATAAGRRTLAHAAANKGSQAKRAAAVVDTLTIGACRDDETAADASFDGHSAGAFTHALLTSLRARPDATWSEVFDLTKREVKRGGFDQTPEMHGPNDLLGAPVFGGRGTARAAPGSDVVDTAALDARIGKAEAAGQWEESATVLEERGRRVTSPVEKTRTYEHLVSLYRTKLGDERRAVGAAEKLLTAVPSHAGAREYLRSMYTAMGNGAGLAALDGHAPAQRAVPVAAPAPSAGGGILASIGAAATAFGQMVAEAPVAYETPRAAGGAPAATATPARAPNAPKRCAYCDGEMASGGRECGSCGASAD